MMKKLAADVSWDGSTEKKRKVFGFILKDGRVEQCPSLVLLVLFLLFIVFVVYFSLVKKCVISGMENPQIHVSQKT